MSKLDPCSQHVFTSRVDEIKEMGDLESILGRCMLNEVMVEAIKFKIAEDDVGNVEDDVE